MLDLADQNSQVIAEGLIHFVRDPRKALTKRGRQNCHGPLDDFLEHRLEVELHEMTVDWPPRAATADATSLINDDLRLGLKHMARSIIAARLMVAA